MFEKSLERSQFRIIKVALLKISNSDSVMVNILCQFRKELQISTDSIKKNGKNQV